MVYLCHSLDGKNNISEIEQLYSLEILHPINFQKRRRGFSNLTDEEFKHNVALAKSIVSRRYSNWSYLVGLLKASKEFNVRALRSINLPLIYSFLIMGILKYFFT
jgi:anthranilate synthase component 1